MFFRTKVSVEVSPENSASHTRAFPHLRGCFSAVCVYARAHYVGQRALHLLLREREREKPWEGEWKIEGFFRMENATDDCLSQKYNGERLGYSLASELG